MTATIAAIPLLDPDSLEFAAFEKIRCTGTGHADGATFVHGGIKYRLTVDIPCRLELTHAVIECIGGPWLRFAGKEKTAMTWTAWGWRCKPWQPE